MRREGDKSVEAVPRRMVDVQTTMQSVRGFGIITRNGAIRRFLASELFRSQKAATLAGVCGFRLSRATRERKLGAIIRHSSRCYNYASALHISTSSRPVLFTSITD